MGKKCRITTLVENTSPGKNLLAEHGLSFWIEYGSHHVLFDTGQGRVITHNAGQLGIDFKHTEIVVLSHGHYDHTGGLEKVLSRAKKPRVYIHPDGFQKKFSCSSEGRAREIGMPELDQAGVRHLAGDLIWTKKPVEIYPGLWVTGEIPRQTEFEDTGGQFYLDKEGRNPDKLWDDQALFFEAAGGLVVILGCAHAGVVNILRYIQKLTGNKKMAAVIGGMHLAQASQARIEQTIEAFRQFDIQSIGPAHCTGQAATARFGNVFPKRCFNCTVGTRLEYKG